MELKVTFDSPWPDGLAMDGFLVALASQPVLTKEQAQELLHTKHTEFKVLATTVKFDIIA